jgi:TfoX/Sxy family transcriptional regulator of competence genes
MMAYDEGLGQRVRELLTETPDLVEKKMFGGIGYIVRGNMACGIHKDSLVVRVGPERYQEALAHPHSRPFDITGRPMTGWVMIAPEGCDSEADLSRWVRSGVDFALTLPPK